MQIIERSALGVRAALYTLSSPDGALRFDLFPMIHIGEQQFYDTIRARLDLCEYVLYEGVASARVRLLVQSYRLIARRSRLGLVCQSDAIKRSDLEARLTHADLTAPEFDRVWAEVPWRLRIAFLVGAPVLGAYWYLTATRSSISERLGRETLPSREDALKFDEGFESLGAALLTHRDERLLATILMTHREHQHEASRVGVLFGAAHIPPVIRLLTERLSYRVEDATWETVFSL